MKYTLALFLISTMWSGLGFSQTDQELVHASLLGGNSFDYLGSIEKAFDGHFIAGSTFSENFPVTPLAYQEFYGGGEEDGFFGKVSEDGSIEFLSFIGGSNFDAVTSVAEVSETSIVLVGITESFDFPIQDAENENHNGLISGWLAKFDTSNELEWSTFVGGDGTIDRLIDVVTDSNDQIFVVGNTNSTDLGTSGTFQEQPDPASTLSGFIGNWSTTGEEIWTSFFSGEGITSLESVALSPDGNTVYAVGFSDGGIVFEGNAHQPVNSGLSDVVLLAFSAENGSLVWGTYLGGESFDNGQSIEVTETGLILISGNTRSTQGISSDTAIQPTLNGSEEDYFVAAFSDAGTRIWSTYFGGSQLDFSFSEVTVRGNEFYLSCSTSSSDMPIFGNPYAIEMSSGFLFPSSGIIAKFSMDGQPLWSTYTNSDYECASCTKISVGDDGSIMCGGFFFQDGFNSVCEDLISPEAYQTTYGGGSNDAALFIFQDNTLSTTFTQAEPLKIYPNPAQDFITIEAPDLLWAGMELTVADLSGRTVDRVARFQSGNAYSTSHLADGVYILTGQIGERMFREKMVVQR